MHVFRPLELAFPAKPGQRFFRPAWFTDLCFFLGQYLLWSGVVLWLLTRFGDWLDGIVPAHFRAAVASQPLVAAGDRSDPAQRLLRLLGPSPAASRRLPVAVPLDPSQCRTSRLARRPSRASARHDLHDGPDQPAGVHARLSRSKRWPASIAFRGIWAIYIHSNVRLPIGPLRMLIGRRSCITGTTTATATPATTPTSRR